MSENATEGIAMDTMVGTGTASPLQRFQYLRHEMKQSLIERDEEINASLVAVLCKEHLCLVGPAGTAKTLLLTMLVNGISGARKFPVLLTKFTVPEEIFGPLDISKLKAGFYHRITDMCLPEAEFVFMDEVFKASSAILNSCLTAMEERRFKNSGHWHPIPLMTLVGASNEWPIGENYQEMGALFDRFLFRLQVRPVSQANKERLLFGNLPPVKQCLTLDDVRDAQTQVEALPWSEVAKESLQLILSELNGQGIRPGDRRVRKAVMACQAQSWLNGNASVEPDDLEILKHILWENPEEHMVKVAETVAKAANPNGAAFSQLMSQAEEQFNLPSVQKMEAGAEFFSAVKKLRKIKEDLVKLQSTATGSNRERIDGALGDMTQRLQKLIAKF